MHQHTEPFGWRRDEDGNLYRPLTPSERARIQTFLQVGGSATGGSTLDDDLAGALADRARPTRPGEHD